MDLATFFAEFKTALFDSYHNNPKDFREKFSWNKNWTKYIQRTLKGILGGNKKEYYPEYFDIDHTWWESNEESFQKVKIREWIFKVAIEHENDSRDWTYEVEKLDSIICPLRIVIGYMPNNEREEEKAIVKKQIEKMKNLEMVSGEFGVILLNKTLENGKEDPLNMKCYRITKKEPIELK